MELNNKRREIEIALRTNDWMDHIDRLGIFSIIDANIPEEVDMLKNALFDEKGLDGEVFKEYLNCYRNNTPIEQNEKKSIGLKDKLLKSIEFLPGDYEQKDIEEILEPILRTEIVLKNKIFKAIKKKTGLNKPDLETIFNFCHKNQTKEKENQSEEIKEEFISEEERQIGTELGKQQNLFYRFSHILNYLSSGESENKLLLLICGIGSYTLKYIQRINVQSQSSAGKSFVSSSVFLKLMPKESTMDLASTSPKFLYYHDFSKTPNMSILYLREIEEFEDIWYQLKNMSEEGLNYAYTDRDENGKLTTFLLHTPPMSIITTTAKSNLTNEDENRGWKIEMDESEVQTTNTMNFNDRKDVDPDFEKKQIDKEKKIKEFQYYIKTLKNYDCKIPTHCLQELFKKSELRFFALFLM
ncbi:hypothetical protein ES708_27325 [subsurface metagenome]